MKPNYIVPAIFAFVIWALPGVASAQTDEPLGEYSVTPGAECQIYTQNNVSVHPGNVLFVVINADRPTQLRIDNVEDEPFTQRIIAFTATPDVDTISAFVRINPDQADPVTSLAIQVICQKPPPDEPTTTTTTTPPPDEPTTTTTPPPPPPPPPPTCVELGTCHPDTGGTEPTPYLLALAGLFGLGGVAVLAKR